MCTCLPKLHGDNDLKVSDNDETHLSELLPESEEEQMSINNSGVNFSDDINEEEKKECGFPGHHFLLCLRKAGCSSC